jgi:AraC-like DNA-binding protein
VSQIEVRSTAFAPSPQLQPYVSRFMVVENLACRTNILLPEAAIIAGFRFRGDCSRDGKSSLRAVFTGLRDRPRVLSHSAGSGTIVAMFTPAGASAMLRQPVQDLFNEVMPIEFQAPRSRLELVEEQLSEADGHADRVRAFERFLLGQLRDHAIDRLVTMAVSCIRESRGNLRIESLARRAGLSQSALERRFRRVVGASPKKFASIVRLRNVVRLRRSGHSLTEIAHEAGYTDQSHFIRDFRRFAGMAPEAFFQSAASFC